MKSDIHLFPAPARSGTAEWVVRASDDDRRSWLQGAPVCPQLDRLRIAHAGVADAAHPYSEVRQDLSGTFLMACFAGRGKVRIEGAWRTLTAGEACIAPPHSFHSYQTVRGHRWGIAWVRYKEGLGCDPIVSGNSPAVLKFDAHPLRAAIAGLYYEAAGRGAPAAMQSWVDLIDFYARLATSPWRTDSRLHRIWKAVSASPAEAWPLARLARVAGLSPRQLTRLCLQSLNRTPARQVSWLRLQCAARLLATTDAKVEAVAREAGYRSLHTFSQLFRRCAGCPPAAYRTAARGTGKSV